MFNEEFYKLEPDDGTKKSTIPKTAVTLVPANGDIDHVVAGKSRIDFDDEEEEGQVAKKDPREQKYRCRFCGLEYKYLNTLKAHERVHDVEEPYVCPSCGMSFRYYSELQGHNLQHRVVPGEKVYKCGCGRTFNKYTDLLYHKHPDDEQEPEYKETLSAGGKEPNYLWKYPDNRKTYYCEFCLKAYSNSHDLKYHIYSHRGERQFTIGASRYLMSRTT